MVGCYSVDDKYDELIMRAILQVCLWLGVITVTASVAGTLLLYAMGYD
tara:strand:+ start:2875 stop:3018 length:144 start_codon:yes stop_codon:yes gene_type:complete